MAKFLKSPPYDASCWIRTSERKSTFTPIRVKWVELFAYAERLIQNHTGVTAADARRKCGI
jgi:hypothetical protein